MAIMNATERFSSRVANYVRYRPGYPPEMLKVLEDECSLTPGTAIADVGSGTGFLAKLFLENGNRVHGIEPTGRCVRQAKISSEIFPILSASSGLPRRPRCRMAALIS